jgi:LEA14-like dessication related protein
VRNRHCVTVLALLLLACATGCSNLQRPTTALKSANLGNVTTDGVDVNFNVAVTNPNPVSIPLSKTGYTLSLGKAKVLEGKLNTDTTVLANGVSELNLPVHVTFDQLLLAEQAIRASGGNVPYTFSGTLDFSGSTPLAMPLNVPFEYKGELPLKRVLSDPAVLLQNPAARELAKRVMGGLLGR